MAGTSSDSAVDVEGEARPHHSVLRNALVAYEGSMLLVVACGPSQCRARDQLDSADSALRTYKTDDLLEAWAQQAQLRATQSRIYGGTRAPPKRQRGAEEAAAEEETEEEGEEAEEEEGGEEEEEYVAGLRSTGAAPTHARCRPRDARDRRPRYRCLCRLELHGH